MNRLKLFRSALLPVCLLAGCAIQPTGPSVLVLPGMGKSFEQFRTDDMQCRYYAVTQSGGVTPSQVATHSGVGTAAVGTAVGAAAGAAIGGGQGAAIGAGTGLLAGTLSGAGSAQLNGFEAQQRYDMSYIQCMYAYGNRVPVNGQFIDATPVGGGYPGASYPPPQPRAPALPPR